MKILTISASKEETILPPHCWIRKWSRSLSYGVSSGSVEKKNQLKVPDKTNKKYTVMKKMFTNNLSSEVTNKLSVNGGNTKQEEIYRKYVSEIQLLLF